MPTILGANTADDSYDISNSLCFNDGDSPDLRLALGSSASGSNTNGTFSFWIKRGSIAAQQILINHYVDSSNYFRMNLRAGDAGSAPAGLEIINVSGGSDAGSRTTNRVFRDVSAWYHIVVSTDSDNSTNEDRVKLYINGTRYTDWASTGTWASTFKHFNDNTTVFIGTREGSSQYYDGYITEVNVIDGTEYDASEFGETNDNGVWIPKEYTGSYGNNGHFLQFKQTGTSANSSGIGADTSGNDKHFTVTNITARSVVQDSPTNNFMTWNPLFTNSRGTFAEGNRQVTTNVQGSVPYGQVEFGNFHVNSGKWYWEVEVPQVGSGGSLGLGANERAYEGTYTNGHNNGGSAGNIRYNHSNGNVNNGSSTAVSGAATYTDDDTIGFAMDLDNNKMYIHKNGTYINSGNPTTGSNGITMTSSYSDYWTPWISKDDTTNNAKVYLNTGNPVLVNDSSNADDNGHGDFEYDVPTGYFALCTKNLAEFG